MDERLLRPSDIARVWGIHPKTLYLWIRQGRLRAVRTPGDQFRLRAKDVVSFCGKSRLEVPPFCEGDKGATAREDARRLIVVGALGRALKALKDSLGNVTIQAFSNTLDGLFAAVTEPPHALVLDAGLAGAETSKIVRSLRKCPAMQKVPIVVLRADSAHMANACVRAGANEALQEGRERDLAQCLAPRVRGDGASRDRDESAPRRMQRARFLA
jgi:excisionase family DNA binding protein